MPWEGTGPSLGFSAVAGWLPAEPAQAPRNAAAQEADPGSVLHHCRRLLALRRQVAALRLGSFEPVETAEDALVFRRRRGAETLPCAFNLGRERLALPAGGALLAGAAPDGSVARVGHAILREGE